MSTPSNDASATPSTPVVVQSAPTNTLAIITLILSLLLPFIPLAQIGGIITGHISLKQLKTSGESGHGLAKAGLIISYILVGLTVIGSIITVIVIMALISASGPNFGY